MKRLLEFTENNFSLVLTLGVPLGLLFPYFSFLENYLTYILMFVLFITFLKIDIIDIVQHLKKPVVLIYVLLIDLILLPVAVYFIFKSFNLNYDYMSAIVLFAALPAGVASSALTEIMGGKTSLTTAITILTHFISPVTVPLIFFLLFRKVIKLDYIGVTLTIIKLIIVPLVLSIIFKLSFKNKLQFFIRGNKILTIIPLIFISLIVMSINHAFIIHNPLETVKYIFISYPIYFFFMFASFFSVYFLNFDEKVAIMNAKTFMNVSLGIVLSLSFLDPKASLIMTMSQIPWSTMILPAEKFAKFMRKYTHTKIPN
jgi:BASS family bile acid:Na+ symporter